MTKGEKVHPLSSSGGTNIWHADAVVKQMLNITMVGSASIIASYTNFTRRTIETFIFCAGKTPTNLVTHEFVTKLKISHFKFSLFYQTHKTIITANWVSEIRYWSAHHE